MFYSKNPLPHLDRDQRVRECFFLSTLLRNRIFIYFLLIAICFICNLFPVVKPSSVARKLLPLSYPPQVARTLLLCHTLHKWVIKVIILQVVINFAALLAVSLIKLLFTYAFLREKLWISVGDGLLCPILSYFLKGNIWLLLAY